MTQQHLHGGDGRHDRASPNEDEVELFAGRPLPEEQTGQCGREEQADSAEEETHCGVDLAAAYEPVRMVLSTSSMRPRMSSAGAA